MTDSISKPQEECDQQEIEELKSFKYLLGDFGIQILAAISRGARKKDAIMMLSGVPMACVHGRMPVLLNLRLVTQSGAEEFGITPRGTRFLHCINEI